MATSIIKMPIQGIVKENKDSSSATVAAGSSANFTIDITKSGYTPLWITGISKSGGGNADCVISAYYFSGTDVIVTVRNVSTSARTISITATIAYIAN